MKPYEFWNSSCREIIVFCQSHLAKRTDSFKQEIDLQEAVTNKLIAGNCMNENTKILLIRDNYPELYKKEEKEQTLEEQRAIFKG